MKNRNYINKARIAACVLILNSCGLTTTKEALLPPVDRAVEITIDALLARSSLSETHFEYYHLESDTLLQECGIATISKDELILSAKEQNVILVEDSFLKTLKSASNILIEHQTESTQSNNSDKRILKKSALSFSRPGIGEITITLGEKKKTINTTVDAIADAKSTELAYLKKLVGLLRSIQKDPCNDSSFFGIGSEPITIKTP